MNDIKLTDNGDLILGNPKTDSDGNIIIKDGKPILDLDIVSNTFCDKQMIYERLMTEQLDWYIYENIGNKLNDLIGQPNTRTTGDLGVKYITDALTYDQFIPINKISVKATPINNNEIVFTVRIQLNENETYNAYVTLNLNKGVEINVD
ncbi:MAG TPA: hypothetical protein VK190_03140 [Pseudoneobacillus sp.]|jgi:hypothetical protein|nr:hypothetical protein [Pseudoneobacillus sp.]